MIYAAKVAHVRKHLHHEWSMIYAAKVAHVPKMSTNQLPSMIIPETVKCSWQHDNLKAWNEMKYSQPTAIKTLKI